MQIDWAVPLILMAIVGMVVYLGFRSIPGKWFILFSMTMGTVMCGYFMSDLAHEDLSYATAQTIGFLVILMLMWSLTQEITPRISRTLAQTSVLRTAVMVLVVILVGITWFAWFEQNHLIHFLNSFTSGVLLLPVISLILLFMAILFWPRYRSIHRSMGLVRRPPIISLLLVALLYFCFPGLILARKALSHPVNSQICLE